MPTPSDFPLVEFLHEHGFFIGNNHMIDKKEFIILEKLIEEFINEN